MKHKCEYCGEMVEKTGVHAHVWGVLCLKCLALVEDIDNGKNEYCNKHKD